MPARRRACTGSGARRPASPADARLRRLQVAHQQPQQRRLADAVAPQHAQQLRPARTSPLDVAQHDGVAVAAGEPIEREQRLQIRLMFRSACSSDRAALRARRPGSRASVPLASRRPWCRTCTRDGKRLDRGHVVLDDQRGRPERLHAGGDDGDLAPGLLPRQAGARLVEQQQPRLREERHRQLEHLALALDNSPAGRGAAASRKSSCRRSDCSSGVCQCRGADLQQLPAPEPVGPQRRCAGCRRR